MDFPFEVCTECFEISGKNKSRVPRLLASKCLEKTRHKCVTVRVREVDGVLEPEIRPVPRAHFKGEFLLCDPEKCRRLKKGETCNFPHCFKEKAAWNAEKFGVIASLSPVTKTPTSPLATPIKIGIYSCSYSTPYTAAMMKCHSLSLRFFRLKFKHQRCAKAEGKNIMYK